jgi:hypothetical protein
MLIAKFVLAERRRPPKGIFQLGVVQNWPKKVSKKIWMRDRFCFQSRHIQSHQNTTKKSAYDISRLQEHPM